MQDARKDQIIIWLTNLYPNHPIQINIASADASFRRYFRTIINNTSYIIMDAPPEKEDTKTFIDIAQLMFKSGSNVPEIIQKNSKQGFLLITDFGNTAYLDELNTQTSNALYQDALNALQVIQTSTPCDQLPKYNEAKLNEEMDLFIDWFIGTHCKIKLTDTHKKTLKATWLTLTNNALKQPQCFVHRDFHSRNLMKIKINNPGIIDFQDAVKGPITYDLVSLLKDCYIQWPRDQVKTWVESYRQQLKQSGIALEDENTFLKWFDLMGLQRHIKVLGIFCRLNYRDGKNHYLNDLPLTYQYTKETARKYPELAAFSELLTDLNLESFIK